MIDSLSHAWQFILDYKDQLDTAGGRGAQWSNWAKAKPLWGTLKDAILQAPVHVVVCLREKAEYAIDSSDDGRGNKKNQVAKIGTKAQAEEGSEYEFTVAWKLDKNTHIASVEKDRTGLFDARAFIIDEGTGHELLQWLGDGEFVQSAEWQLLTMGVSDDFKAASEEANKIRKDQARTVMSTAQSLGRSPTQARRPMQRARSRLHSAVLDADRYGAADADRLIRYVASSPATWILFLYAENSREEKLLGP